MEVLLGWHGLSKFSSLLHVTVSTHLRPHRSSLWSLSCIWLFSNHQLKSHTSSKTWSGTCVAIRIGAALVQLPTLFPERQSCRFSKSLLQPALKSANQDHHHYHQGLGHQARINEQITCYSKHCQLHNRRSNLVASLQFISHRFWYLEHRHSSYLWWSNRELFIALHEPTSHKLQLGFQMSRKSLDCLTCILSYGLCLLHS